MKITEEVKLNQHTYLISVTLNYSYNISQSAWCKIDAQFRELAYAWYIKRITNFVEGEGESGHFLKVEDNPNLSACQISRQNYM